MGPITNIILIFADEDKNIKIELTKGTHYIDAIL